MLLLNPWQCGSDGHIIVNNVAQCYATSSDNPPPNIDKYEGISDTDTTKHYITEELLPICSDVATTNGPYVTVADGDIYLPLKKSYHSRISSQGMLK